MGVTYKAIDTRLDKPVALKVIGAELLNSPQARRRFLREAQTAAKIDHPHVATVLYFGEEGDTYFYAMQFVNGEDLERYVERLGPLSAATALRVTMQVAQALEAANDQELIHRDIKPGNIMAIANRSGSLDVKLIDFGLARAAKAAGLDVTQLTGTRDFVGSPAFASPEQAEMSELDTRSDIYSLGVTLWYLLSAKRPFSGTVGQVMIAHAVKPPPFEQLAGVPLPVIDLLRRMLAKSREDRPQNPRELQQEIETVIAKLAAEFSPLPGQTAPEAAPPVAPEAALPPADDKLELATLLPAVASPSFDGYFGIQIGSLVSDRYRLIEEEREGTGGRLFRATDEKALSDTTAEVALKLLHPGIATDPNLVDLLDNELGVIRNASHPNLVQYRKLEAERSTVPGKGMDPWISAVRFAPVAAFAQLERAAHALRAVGCNVGFRRQSRARLGQCQRPKDPGRLSCRDLSGDLSCPGPWRCRALVELLSETQSPLYCSALVTQPGRLGQTNVGSGQPGVVDDPGRGRDSRHEIRLAFRPPHLRIA